MSADAIVRFPEGFLWGSATSAHQVEGGNRWNDWWRFENRSEYIASDHRSGDACKHWEMFDRDFGLAAADGHTAHRFSLEWSRIEPERGRIDPAAVAHYHDVLASLRRHSIRPIVTLAHFTVPLWIANQGSWESQDTIDRFCEFVRFCAREYGGEVDWWCTINEPEVLAFRGWSEALWPPVVKDDSRALAVIGNQLVAHGRAFHILHDEDRIDADGDGAAARVGFAKHYTPLLPLRWWSLLDRLRAWFENKAFNDAVLEAVTSGRITLAIPGRRGVRRQVPELVGSLDWIGLNYYTRWYVNAIGGESHIARRGANVTDMMWEIVPDGLADAAVRVAATGVPVIVTEHGFADAEDRFRPRALVDALTGLGRVIAAGTPVLGYMHWSLMDNFEWAEGFGPRFGLYRVDALTDPAGRERRRSADVYARIIKANAITPELAREVQIGSGASHPVAASSTSRNASP